MTYEDIQPHADSGHYVILRITHCVISECVYTAYRLPCSWSSSNTFQTAYALAFSIDVTAFKLHMRRRLYCQQDVCKLVITDSLQLGQTCKVMSPPLSDCQPSLLQQLDLRLGGCPLTYNGYHVQVYKGIYDLVSYRSSIVTDPPYSCDIPRT